MMHEVDVRTGKSALDEARAEMQCSPAQMRIALSRLGMLDAVEGIVASSPEAQIAWEYSTYISRNSSFISSLGGNFTDKQIDDIFKAAMNVTF